jgi:hypothetical protein
MTAIMSIDEPRPRGTVLGERADRRRFGEAGHYFRCKACNGWIDARDYGMDRGSRRPAAAPGEMEFSSSNWHSWAAPLFVPPYFHRRGQTHLSEVFFCD